MYVKPAFGAVYRLMRDGQPVTDGAVVSQIRAADPSKLPEGDMHMNHPAGTAKGYYIISEPDTDTFTAMTRNLNTAADWTALANALLEKRQDFNL